MNGESDQTFSFLPRCVQVGDRLIFDSGCTVDLGRCVRGVPVPQGGFSVETKSDGIVQIDGSSCFKILVLVHTEESRNVYEKAGLLAEILIPIAVQQDSADAILQIEHTIRNASASAVFRVLANQETQEIAPPMRRLVEGVQERQERSPSFGHGARSIRSLSERLMASLKSPLNFILFVAAPVVIFIAFFVFFKMDRTPESKAASLLQADPAAVEAQVALTRETLKQMGIDPGKPSDLGCLAPK